MSGRLTGVTSQYGGIFTRARNRPDALGVCGRLVIILPQMSGKREIIPVTQKKSASDVSVDYRIALCKILFWANYNVLLALFVIQRTPRSAST